MRLFWPIGRCTESQETKCWAWVSMLFLGQQKDVPRSALLGVNFNMKTLKGWMRSPVQDNFSLYSILVSYCSTSFIKRDFHLENLRYFSLVIVSVNKTFIGFVIEIFKKIQNEIIILFKCILRKWLRVFFWYCGIHRFCTVGISTTE